MKFGQWLAAERKRKAFTQDALALATCHSQAAIGAIENGDDRAVVRAVVVALRDRRKKSPAG